MAKSLGWVVQTINYNAECEERRLLQDAYGSVIVFTDHEDADYHAAHVFYSGGVEILALVRYDKRQRRERRETLQRRLDEFNQ